MRTQSDYETIMNDIAKDILANNIRYDRCTELDWHFVHAVEKVSKCYARSSIMRDGMACLNIVRSGCVFQDRKNRVKYDPDELAKIRIRSKPRVLDKLPPKSDEVNVDSLLSFLRTTKKGW